MKIRVKEEEFIAGEEDRDLAKLAFNKTKAKVNRNLLIFIGVFILFGGLLLLVSPVGPIILLVR